MELRFSRQALADLDDLKQWLGPRSPQGHRSVAAALSRCIRKLTDHLDAGRPTAMPDIRELIEPRYGFIIPYTQRGGIIWILRVYSARRYPLNLTEINRPPDAS